MDVIHQAPILAMANNSPGQNDNKAIDSVPAAVADNTFAPKIIDDLHRSLPYINQKSKFENFVDSSAYKMIKSWSINLGPMATAAGHTIAAISDLFHFNKFNSPLRKMFDGIALTLSKAVLTANCIFNGLEAFRENRLWEMISRFIEPVFILLEQRTEDLGLARGIGLGISQIAESQGGIVEELKNLRGIKKQTMGEDHDMNTSAFKKIGKELLTDGLGSQRRFMTGFEPSKLKLKLAEFWKDFNLGGIKELFSGKGNLAERYVSFLNKTGFEHIREICEGDKSKDKGHTTALSGHIMVLGSLFGYMDKAKKGLLYKVGGTLRNLGGAIADVGIFGHPDPYFNVSAIFLSVNTFMDIVQRFIPPTLKNIILPWSNISMAAYNVGVGIYLNRSNMKTNAKDVVKNYDTDINIKAPQQVNLAMAA
jgi:hypothetical protein